MSVGAGGKIMREAKRVADLMGRKLANACEQHCIDLVSIGRIRQIFDIRQKRKIASVSGGRILGGEA